MKALYVVVLVAVLAACASIKLAPVQVGDRCFNCDRTIGNLHMAAALVDQLQTPRPFRSAN